MILRKRLEEPCTLIRLGALCLILANLSHRFLHPTTDFWQGVADGATGMLFGLSIGCFLLSVRRTKHRCSHDEVAPR